MITQLPERCWVLRPETVLGDYDKHFPSAARTQLHAKELGLTGTSEQLPEPCWTVRCDGGCETLIDEEGECYIVHSGSHAEAERLAKDYEWTITVDGLVICDYDADA